MTSSDSEPGTAIAPPIARESRTTSGASTPRSRNGYSNEAVLLACVGLILVLLAFTAVISRLYHKDVHVLADQWFASGEAELAAGNAQRAIVDYQNALVYSPGNPIFQFHLAQALLAAGGGEKARSYLLNLLSESPASGQINLELARIAASEKGSAQDAIRYYNAAIYGVWDQDPIVMRWNVRRELCGYLLAHNMRSQAEPEIIALAQEVPPGDAQRRKDAGALLLRVGLWNRAFDEYHAVLITHKHDSDALLGAATASFQLGQYTRALSFLDALPPEKQADPEVSSMMETARAVDAENPYNLGLSAAERARRAAKAIELATSRAQQCIARTGPLNPDSAPTPVQESLAAMRAMASKWSRQNLARNPALIDDAMKVVFQLENAAQQQCGTPERTADRALLLIAQSRFGAQP
ncbi:MAG TPA: tetratricopeptide repeat protein [Candidatus Acidoferrum sp.]|nr:tetratricopeptide repeat protein [Candidatus Acidoferrum sp.]